MAFSMAACADPGALSACTVAEPMRTVRMVGMVTRMVGDDVQDDETGRHGCLAQDVNLDLGHHQRILLYSALKRCTRRMSSGDSRGVHVVVLPIEIANSQQNHTRERHPMHHIDSVLQSHVGTR